MPAPTGDELSDAESRAETDFRLIGAQGGHASWARTPDRAARMRKPLAASPQGIAWHAKQLGFDPDNLSPGELQQAESARRAYLLDMSRKSKEARRRRKTQHIAEGGGGA